MPIREKAVISGLRMALGTEPGVAAAVSFRILEDTVKINGLVYPRGHYDALRERADGVFETVVEGIDWNRVMLEASARHGALEDNPDHDKQDVGKQYDDVICPECIREALLCGRTWQDWAVEPRAERRVR
jgi:hypothetical protein